MIFKVLPTVYAISMVSSSQNSGFQFHYKIEFKSMVEITILFRLLSLDDQCSTEDGDASNETKEKCFKLDYKDDLSYTVETYVISVISILSSFLSTLFLLIMRSIRCYLIEIDDGWTKC